jgi:hypothetical protein
MYRNKVWICAFFVLCLMGSVMVNFWDTNGGEAQARADATPTPPQMAPITPYSVGDMFARMPRY